MIRSDILPLVVILGPTASGKTSLAIDTAERYNGEIICADSRSIYKGLDIGTAKPTSDERSRVVHWGLDLVEPGERFTAFDFKAYAESKIKDIRQRGKIPIIAGGTGLYIDSIIFDYIFPSEIDIDLRQKIEDMSDMDIRNYCKLNNINIPEGMINRRHLIGVLSRGAVKPQRRETPIDSSIIVGISTDKHTLRRRIEERASQIFFDGVVEEATILGQTHGWDSAAMTGNIYPIVRRYLNGEVTYDQLRDEFVTSDWRLAKRQLTWFKRNKYIKWLDSKSAAAYIGSHLDTE